MIIHSFFCKNFYSFKETNSLSFDVNEKAPENNGYFNAFGNRVSKMETVIGSNASGKTNLLKVLPFLKWLIVDSYSSDPKDKIPVKSFISSSQEPTELGVEFEADNELYIYSVSLTEERILSEGLEIKNKSDKQITKKNIFLRVWDEENKKYIFKNQKLGLSRELINPVLRANSSIISVAKQFENPLSLLISNTWEMVSSNVVEAGWVGDIFPMKKNLELVNSLLFYIENPKLKNMAEKILSKFDLGLESFKLLKEEIENTSGIHLIDGKKQELNIKYESSGTKQLFILLTAILTVLDRGGVAVLDEIDINLHPEIVWALCELFIDPEINIYNAQLLFSTHSHFILSKLDKYQIVLAEKNENGVSECWRLDSMENVRADDNYFTKYMSGAYGAVPRL